MNYSGQLTLSEQAVSIALDDQRSRAVATAWQKGLMRQGSDGDIGYAFCLYYAATACETTPPSVALHGSASRLNSRTCPPKYLSLFERWAAIVGCIACLDGWQKQQLEHQISDTEYVADPYTEPLAPAQFWHLLGRSPEDAISTVASDLLALAHDIYTCRTSSSQRGRRPPPSVYSQGYPWPPSTSNPQTPFYQTPSSTTAHPMLLPQDVSSWANYQSASPVDLTSNPLPFHSITVPLNSPDGAMISQNPTLSPGSINEQGRMIGGFVQPPPSPGGFRPTSHYPPMSMPSAQPYNHPNPSWENNPHSIQTPFSAPQPHPQSGSRPQPIWTDINETDNRARNTSHKKTFSVETTTSIGCYSSAGTFGSWGARTSSGSTSLFETLSPLEPCVPEIGLAALTEGLSLGEDTTTWAQTIPLTGRVMPTQDRTPSGVPAVGDATASVRPVATPIGVNTPMADVIAQLCAHGCKNLNHELNHSSISTRPLENGGFGLVYRGLLKDGTPVALKVLGLREDHNSKHLKHAAKELETWSRCDHRNVAQLLGLAELDGRIAMVSRWMKNNSLHRYLQGRTVLDKLAFCFQTADALSYLHSNNIVHGDLKGPNVLVSDDGNPVLIDFGNAILSEYAIAYTQTSGDQEISVRWTAPELMNGTKPSRESDVYALGMTILEIFTGNTPYHNRGKPAVMFGVSQWKEIPDRPTDCIPPDQFWSDSLWRLLMSCWDYKPEYRPLAAEVREHLSKIKESSDG